jgi:hypothetical protein
MAAENKPGETRAKYEAGTLRKPLTKEKKLAFIEEMVKLGADLEAKCGPVDVTELIRQVRGEDDDQN